LLFFSSYSWLLDWTIRKFQGIRTSWLSRPLFISTPKVHSTQQFLSLTSQQQPPKKALVENDGRRFETGPGPGPNQYQQFEE
jgi:hypothetical protein